MSVIDEARIAAAACMDRRGRQTEADIVRAGGGDDFPEMQAALHALSRMSAKVERLERALQCYADGTFWDADLYTESLAIHDAGQIARMALAGKELFQQHRD